MIGCAGPDSRSTPAAPAPAPAATSSPPQSPPMLPRPVQPQAAKAAAEVIKAAIGQADTLAAEGKVARAIVHYYQSCGQAVGVLGEDTDVGQKLRTSFQRLPLGGEDSPSTVSAMRAAMDAAYVALTFAVIEEAPRPAGFPPPGRVGIVTLKRYPASRVARRSVRNAEVFADADELFAPLSAYLAGEGLAMTRPWAIWFDGPAEDPTAAGIFYVNPRTGAAGRHLGFDVADLPATAVVSMGFVGVANRALADAAADELRRWLGRYRPSTPTLGRMRILQYNSSKTPAFLRYWEVQTEVFDAQKPGEKKR